MWCHLISILYRICHVYQQWQVLPRQPGIILGFSLNWRWQVLSFLFFSFLAGACTGSCFRAAMMCWWVSGKLHHSDSLWQGFVTVQSTILKAKQKQQKCCQRQLVPQNWHYTDVMCCWKLCKGETLQRNRTGLKHARVRIVVSDFSNKTIWPWQMMWWLHWLICWQAWCRCSEQPALEGQDLLLWARKPKHNCFCYHADKQM